jgi:hypothetical protein
MLVSSEGKVVFVSLSSLSLFKICAGISSVISLIYSCTHSGSSLYISVSLSLSLATGLVLLVPCSHDGSSTCRSSALCIDGFSFPAKIVNFCCSSSLISLFAVHFGKVYLKRLAFSGASLFVPDVDLKCCRSVNSNDLWHGEDGLLACVFGGVELNGSRFPSLERRTGYRLPDQRERKSRCRDL